MTDKPIHTGIEFLVEADAEEVLEPPIAIDLVDAERLSRIELVFFDCDGVMTDGRVWVDAAGNEQKSFSVIDGHGIAMLRQAGVRIAMVTRSPHGIPTARAQKLSFDVIRTGVMDKATEVRKIRAELNLQMDQTAFMGDDLPDLSAFLEVGLRIAPPQARAQVLRMAHATTRAKPGHGAVREVCDAFIRARLPRTGAP